MKDLMLLFGVNIAKRYSQRQKRIFFSQAIPYFQDLGYQVEFQENSNKHSKLANILIGDLKAAHTWVLAPYDTPTRTLLPYRYYPFNRQENIRQDNLDIALHLLIYLLLCVLVWFFSSQFGALSMAQRVIGIVILALLFLFSSWLISGIPNLFNFNKNSASVALVASLAKANSGNRGVAYVLLDKAVSSYEGINALSKAFPGHGKTILYLDCVADGEKMTVAFGQNTGKKAQPLLRQLTDLQPIVKEFQDLRLEDNYFKYFPNMITICCGSIVKQRFVVLGTRSRKDMKVDIPRLERLRDGITAYLGGAPE